MGQVSFSRSYHDGEHYNSVRLANDPGDGPARPILIKVFYQNPVAQLLC